jgi:hypothetical protein
MKETATHIETHSSDRQKCKYLLGLDNWNRVLGYWKSKNNFRCCKGSASLLSLGQVSILTLGKSSGRMLDDVIDSLPILRYIGTRPLDDGNVRVFDPAESILCTFRLMFFLIVKRDLDFV